MNKVLNTSVGILALLLVFRPAYGQEGWAPADGSWLEVEVTAPEERPKETPENIQAGKEIYTRDCSQCHGEKGDGEGGAVFGPEGDLRILPRPRDFQKAIYKFRTTESQYPLDEDLFRTITRGVPGTAMPHFDKSKSPTSLTENERWQVVYAIKDFARTSKDEKKFDRAKDRGKIKKVKEIDIPQPERTDALLKRGRKIYNEQCIKCHSERGRGEGELTIKDSEWDLPIMPTNFTRAENYKTGATVREIHRATSTGLISTMTNFNELSNEDRWAVSYYIYSFIPQEDANSEGVVLRAAYRTTIPDDPSDAAWGEVEAITIPLAGQILEDPKLWTPSILSVEVKALYNEKEIAFLLQWDDREWSVGEASDAAAIQFPVKIPDGPRKPFFLYGQRGRPVNIWHWHGDRYFWEAAGRMKLPDLPDLKSTTGEDAVIGDVTLTLKGHKGNLDKTGAAYVKEYHEFMQELVDLAGPARNAMKVKDFVAFLKSPPSPSRSVEELNATGLASITVQPEEPNAVSSRAKWSDGRWSVIMKRSRTTEDTKNDIQFDESLDESGRLIPVAFFLWNGFNHENGARMNMSCWYYLQLEPPFRPVVLAYCAGVMLVVISLLWLTVRKARRLRANAANLRV
jgi:mono/diheme cytochrome c family protein